MENQSITTYQMLDGKIFEATSVTDLIEQMRTDSFQSSKDLKDFMVNVSVNSYEYNHSNIRTNSHQNFVNDLIKGGFVKTLNE
jgi:hypothetical protein